MPSYTRGTYPWRPPRPRTFYVDFVNGSDDNDGLTSLTPFLTYEKVLSMCVPGEPRTLTFIGGAPMDVDNVS